MLRTQQTKLNQVATRAAWAIQLSLCTLARVWWFGYTCILVPCGTCIMPVTNVTWLSGPRSTKQLAPQKTQQQITHKVEQQLDYEWHVVTTSSVDRPQYIRMKLVDIPTEIIQEYNLNDPVEPDGSIFIEVCMVCHKAVYYRTNCLKKDSMKMVTFKANLPLDCGCTNGDQSSSPLSSTNLE